MKFSNTFFLVGIKIWCYNLFLISEKGTLLLFLHSIGGSFMKKLSLLAIALVALFTISCVSAPVAGYGSVDKSKVEVLANGKAKVIDFISFNDFHATLDEQATGKDSGVAKLATMILDAKKANPNTMLLSGGDSYQGSALSALTKGKIVSEYFKLVGLSYSAVGNHELDWGLDNFANWEKDGNIEFLAANVTLKSTGKAPAWAKPYKVLTIGGHKVAIIGLMTLDTLTTVKMETVNQLNITNPAVAAAAVVAELQKSEKPEAILVLSHIPSGADKADPTKVIAMASNLELDAICKVPGIDAVITGHSHMSVVGTNNGVPVVQAYYNGRSLGKISITFNDDGTKKVTPSLNDFYKNKKDIAENADAKALVAKYNAEFGKELKNKVFTLTNDMTHDKGVNVTPMGYWLCETLRARYGLDVYVQNGGGVRTGFLAGDILVENFWALMPFDNYTVTFELSGADLKAAIEHGLDSPDFGNGQFAGIIVTYDPAAPYKSKIVSMKLANGTAIDPAKMYKVGTNDFQFGGGDKYTMMKPVAKNIVETFEPVRDILLAEAKKAGNITAPVVNVLVKK